jgi:intracellular sulfur oxidation DsrE/DsrF family protein
MNSQTPYSDEHINAYIDGELDNEECARLLYDEQHDTELAQRIGDARSLKEKVQLAYAGISNQAPEKKSFSCTAFVNKQRSIVAGIIAIIVTAAILLPTFLSNNENLASAKQLIKNSVAISPDRIASTIADNRQVVINLSQYQPETFDDTIDHIEVILQQHRDDLTFKVEMIAHRDGLKALDTKTSEHVERISQLAIRYNNFDVVACAKSLADLSDAGNPVQLMSDILLTPSAAEQVAKRTGDGWLYLKL